MEPDHVLMGYSLKQQMKIFFSRYHVTTKEEQDDYLAQAKKIKRNFLIELAKAYQHYLPLDNDFLRYLQYVCPKKATEHHDAEKYLLRIAKNLANYDATTEADNLKKEIRMMRDQKEDFGDGLKTYLTKGGIQAPTRQREEYLYWKGVGTNNI